MTAKLIISKIEEDVSLLGKSVDAIAIADKIDAIPHEILANISEVKERVVV